MINILDIPVKQTINRTLAGKSIIIAGHSKTGKSTVGSQASRPVFLCTENGTEALTGITPVPISSWSDFKQAVTQLCNPVLKERFDTVVIDSYTNLILLLDKYIGNKLSSEKNTYDFGSDADYGRGSKSMRNELGLQLQKLSNQGYLIINIVHTEDKVDFATGKSYIGSTLSGSLYGVAEKFVDQIIYLSKSEDKRGRIDFRAWFNSKGGFSGAGGRFNPEVDSVPTSFKNIENELLKAIDKLGTDSTVTLVENKAPSVIIHSVEDEFNFDALMEEFNEITETLVEESAENVSRISKCVSEILGPNRKASSLSRGQAELLYETIQRLKEEFNIE